MALVPSAGGDHNCSAGGAALREAADDRPASPPALGDGGTAAGGHA